MTDRRLFSPFTLGPITLTSRIVMAPMTRSRSPGNVPDDLVATYYAQRASAGLIITEGTSPSPNGVGYARIPGLYDAAQVAGWKKVTDAVHAKGGHIYAQLMHTGRVSHPENLPPGARVLGPSPLATPGEMWVDGKGQQPFPVPTEMTEADVVAAIGEFGAAAANARAAGFDGVEIHGANGYLVEQFLAAATNQRKDQWGGGSIASRVRFALAVVDAASKAIGADRVGIRLSPYGVFNGTGPDALTDDLYRSLVTELDARKIAYVHLVDHSSMGAPKPSAELVADVRKLFTGTIIHSGGFDAARAEAELAAGKADLVAFGRPFIGNPDLPAKLASGAPLVEPDQTTFYTPGEKGYTDYAA
ncbi:MAG: NADH:flavin oxidoreductase/NADH oxidase [Labilithrix sp.]|nr:NADH:flavin oxidoreductase/NADH oxidase [Labilithrix sp.]